MTCCEHPAPGQTFRCEKHRIEMCANCMTCRDPELYCKFRSACIIQFQEKENARQRSTSPKEPQDHDAAEPSV